MNNILLQDIPLTKSITESAVTFTSVGDSRLVGNLLRPQQSLDYGLLFIHGYAGNRNGPHGLLTFLARQAAAIGLPSLRFDLCGRGESEGDGKETNLAGMAADLVAAEKFLCDSCELRKVIVVGLCSGGNVAIGALPQLSATAALFLISVYPFSDGDNFSRDVNRTLHFARQYWHKARQPETWRRLCRGDVSLMRVADVLFGHFVPSKKRKMNVQSESSSESKPDKKTAIPPREHLAKLSAKLPVCMIYGSADPDREAARDYYESYAKDHNLPLNFEEIAGANHNFSSVQWKKELSDHLHHFFQQLAATDL